MLSKKRAGEKALTGRAKSLSCTWISAGMCNRFAVCGVDVSALTPEFSGAAQADYLY